MRQGTFWGRREKGYTEDTEGRDGYIHSLAESHPGLGAVKTKRSWRKKGKRPVQQKALEQGACGI